MSAAGHTHDYALGLAAAGEAIHRLFDNDDAWEAASDKAWDDMAAPQPVPAQDGPLRCLHTTNLCGTDTWQVGRPCRCANCQTYLAQDEPEPSVEHEPQPPSLLALVNGAAYWMAPTSSTDRQDIERAKGYLRQAVHLLMAPAPAPPPHQDVEALDAILARRVGDDLCDDCMGSLVVFEGDPRHEEHTERPCPDCVPREPATHDIPRALLLRVRDALTRLARRAPADQGQRETLTAEIEKLPRWRDVEIHPNDPESPVYTEIRKDADGCWFEVRDVLAALQRARETGGEQL